MPEEQEKLLSEIKNQVSEIVENKLKVSEDKVAKLESELKVIAEKDSTAGAELKAEVIRVAEMVEAMKEQGKQNKAKKVTLAEEIKANKDALKGILNGGTSEMTLKANVTRASIADNEHAIDLPNIGQLGHRRLSAYELFPKFNVAEGNHNGTIRYVDWDDATKVRAAAMRNEGAAFPESTAAWVTKTISLQKIGDTLPVTEEFFEDEQMAANELDMFLRTNVEIVRDTQIVSGDGTAPNLSGVYTTAPTYTAAASGISDPSIYDLLTVMRTSITSVYGAKYNPDFALMNSADILKMKLKKDANENYIIPPFTLNNGQVVDSMIVIENNAITANTLVLGDRRFGRIYEMGGITLTRGRVDAQFSSDMETLKVRQRLLMLVREVDKTGFLKCTSISAALTTLAT